ncbi:hypothetical protein N0V82_007695 [Gnomoniopsis sp. IMI 355080]|nr:hypothetical protein N0V82_007695 [Gnomoniopsis sp. IMI 355080]
MSTVSAHTRDFPIDLYEYGMDNDDEKELRDLERLGYGPRSQVKLCTAQSIRICSPGSALMVNIRGSGDGRGGGGGWKFFGLRSSSSVRNVESLPDLSSAQAFLTHGFGGRTRDEMGTSKLAVMREQPEKKKKKEDTALEVVLPREKRVGRALKKKISTQRFNFQGGGVRELVRSIGF